MQPTEALQRILSAARVTIAEGLIGDVASDTGLNAEQELDQQAMSLCSSFLNTAVPLSRFRCFITVEAIGQKSKLGLGDFVVTGTTISSIKNGLIGLSMEKVTILAYLWEHVEGGRFEMHCGYQGSTKTLAFRSWLAEIDRFEAERVAS